MRKFYILVALVSALLSSCVDGEDGDAFLAFYWTTTPTFYSDNNASLPLTIVFLEQYAVSPGTYSFTYTVGSTYSGSYTITEEEGDTGIFPLIPGKDGDDSNFELGLLSTGPTFIAYSAGLETTADQSNGTDIGNKNSLVRNEFIESNPSNGNEETVLSQTKGRYTLTLRYRKQ